MESNFFSRNSNNGDTEANLFAQMLLISNKDLFFKTLYNAIVVNTAYVIVSDISDERKTQIINQMIKYYEGREDYEKCANLLKIKKEIELC
jgi:hypothetical protein